MKTGPFSFLLKKTPLKFLLLFGLVSFFADVTYEGARSITGPFLATLGVSATIVGFVAGFGEMIGYVLRLLSGYIIDRTAQYWIVAIIGYAINLFAVPLLALADHWTFAAILIVLERAGKGIRVPARDVMLSYAAIPIGAGRGFGIHEALDKLGAMTGPIIVSAILFVKNDYKLAFAWLFIPALIALILLFMLRSLYLDPQKLELSSDTIEHKRNKKESEGVRASETTKENFKQFDIFFWVYVIGASFIAMGYVDFALIAYHFHKIGTLDTVWIPMAYAMALGTGAISALCFGYLYDKIGFLLLIISTVLSAFFAPLVFFGNTITALFGMLLWGIGLGVQSSVMRAVVAKMIMPKQRGLAYGIFNTAFGIFWFLGSALMGFLYDLNVFTLVIFSVCTQLFAIPFFLFVRRH